MKIFVKKLNKEINGIDIAINMLLHYKKPHLLPFFLMDHPIKIGLPLFFFTSSLV